jgi:hypothetical protein
MRDRDLVVAYAMLQSSETADHHEAYKRIRLKGEKGCSFLLGNLLLADDRMKLRIIDLFTRMLVLDTPYHEIVKNGLLQFIEDNPNSLLRTNAVEALVVHLKFFPNESLAKTLLPYLLIETDFDLVYVLATYYGKHQMRMAIPYLEVLAVDSDMQIASLASQILEKFQPPKINYEILMLIDSLCAKLDAEKAQNNGSVV